MMQDIQNLNIKKQKHIIIKYLNFWEIFKRSNQYLIYIFLEIKKCEKRHFKIKSNFKLFQFYHKIRKCVKYVLFIKASTNQLHSITKTIPIIFLIPGEKLSKVFSKNALKCTNVLQIKTLVNTEIPTKTLIFTKSQKSVKPRS